MTAKCELHIGLTIEIYDRMTVAAVVLMPLQVHPSNNDSLRIPTELQNVLFVTIGAETS